MQLIKLNTKNKKIIIICLAILLIIFTIYSMYTSFFIEKFTQPDYNTLISNWDNGSGFYSELGFKLNHYLFCKKYQINFKMNMNNWPYTFKDGWIDYFEDIKLNYDQNQGDVSITHTEQGCCTILEQFPLRDYVSIIPEFYKYNQNTKKHIEDIKSKLGLIKQQYGAVYIRRGDKLVDEIKYIPSSKFADLLLEKFPNCQTIFVQTDDYNSYLDIKTHVYDKLKKQNINILTLCPENVFGAVANSGYIDKMQNNNINTLKEGNDMLNDNKDYVNKIKNNLSKPISDMNLQERYDHTMELLTSVDICINSKYCICDYKSNVSRFIKIAHNHFDHVFDVNNTDTQISLDSKLCPSFDFDSKHQNI
jgi:hypothetical protein